MKDLDFLIVAAVAALVLGTWDAKRTGSMEQKVLEEFLAEGPHWEGDSFRGVRYVGKYQSAQKNPGD